MTDTDSICNNGGLTPAELAVSCGQEECARFLHSASTQKQHTPINGTTTTQQINTAVVMETSALHNSEQNGDCEMEVSESDKVVTNGYSRVGDVTLSHDISVSVTRVAGRKRSWDCGGVAECKRMRRTDSSPFSVAVNGFRCGDGLRMESGLHWENGLECKDAPRAENSLNGTLSSPLVWGAEIGGGSDALTTSAIEHENSVLLELGYDALCCNVLLNTCHGS